VIYLGSRKFCSASSSSCWFWVYGSCSRSLAASSIGPSRPGSFMTVECLESQSIIRNKVVYLRMHETMDHVNIVECRKLCSDSFVIYYFRTVLVFKAMTPQAEILDLLPCRLCPLIAPWIDAKHTPLPVPPSIEICSPIHRLPKIFHVEIQASHPRIRPVTSIPPSLLMLFLPSLVSLVWRGAVR